jgi:formylglycine-generating enzyme
MFPLNHRLHSSTFWLILMASMTCLGGCNQQPEGDSDTVAVPAGWFLMGSDDGRRSNQPQHRVYLDSFFIQRIEVSREEFARFVDATSYQAAGWEGISDESDANLPVVGVLWQDASAYCEWTGMRLPSEAEWEKAARGEDGRNYPWGAEWDSARANTADGGPMALQPVESHPNGASTYGALNMAGNAAEWVADYFSFDYYLNAPAHNPEGPSQIMDHVIRGGSYLSPSEYATTYFRDSSHSVRPNQRVGFRCALSAEAAELP